VSRVRKARPGPRLLKPPAGKHQLAALDASPNALEREVLGPLDADKLSDLAECLFALNNRHFGPIPGAYVVVCVSPGWRWCVGQLCADRARPLALFEDEVFTSAAAAQARAEAIRTARGERLPRRDD
jgi:hypothetical protein